MPSNSKSCNSVQATTVQCQERFSPSVFLNVVPLKVKYLDIIKEIYAFLDQGSTTFFCYHNLAKDLKQRFPTRVRGLNLRPQAHQQVAKLLFIFDRYKHQ